MENLVSILLEGAKCTDLFNYFRKFVFCADMYILSLFERDVNRRILEVLLDPNALPV